MSEEIEGVREETTDSEGTVNENSWDRFYRSAEEDLQSDRPTRKVIGVAKRFLMRGIMAILLASVAAISVYVAGLLGVFVLLSIKIGTAATFLTTAPLFYSFGYTAWLPGNSED